MTHGTDPVLSVIIPVWNGERYLAEAITSVLDQKAAPALEVIVIDDGSEDDSSVVAEQFGPQVRCARVAHGGLAAARNSGIALARGEYLLHFDADDLLPPESIASRMAPFASPAAPDLVVGQMFSFVSPDLDCETATRYQVPPGPQRGGLSGATVVRTSFAAKVGELDIRRTHGADLDWMVRAMERGARVVEVSEVVLYRRIHGGNMSLTDGQLAVDRLATVRAALRRRSAEGRSAGLANPDSLPSPLTYLEPEDELDRQRAVEGG